MKRFSVVYTLRGQYQHVGCATHQEAQTVLQTLSTHKKRVPVGIYDAKTELFEWEPTRQHEYHEAGIEVEGKRGDQIISIVQALRRRDAGWLPASEFQRPSFFA